MADLKQYIREVRDFPKPGIQFYDVTTLLQNPEGFKEALNQMQAYIEPKQPTKLVGIEARGFILAGALADRLGLGFIAARKPGKLPAETIRQSYELEYGSNTLEMHIDAIAPGDKVIIIDDLIATGGTLAATCQLIEQLGGRVCGISSIIGLPFLPFQEQLRDYDIHYLVSYDSE